MPRSRRDIAIFGELAKLREDPENQKLLLFKCWKNSSALSQAFKRLTKRAGLDGFVIHDFRHEGIPRLISTKMSAPEIMKMTGHTNASTLVKYSRLRASDGTIQSANPPKGKRENLPSRSAAARRAVLCSVGEAIKSKGPCGPL